MLTVLFLSACASDTPVSPSERLSGIDVLSFYTDYDSYTRLRTNKVLNTEIPVNIFYKNENFTGKIRSAGSGSKYHPRWGFNVKLQDGFIEGFKRFNLSSQVFDRTGLNTILAIRLYGELGFPVHFVKPVFLRINSDDEGLYPLIERVDSSFFSRRGLEVYELYKLSFDADFSFDDDFVPEFVVDKEIPDNDNYTSLHELIHTLDTAGVRTINTTLKNDLDLENYLRYHALTSLLNNYDAFTNNFFLYKKTPDSPFQVIPWDFDKCFSTEPDVGAAGENEIIFKLFQSEEIKARYKNIVKDIANNYFNENFLSPIIDENAALIRDAYNLDPYLGKEGRYNFDNEISRLKEFVKNRFNNISIELENL